MNNSITFDQNPLLPLLPQATSHSTSSSSQIIWRLNDDFQWFLYCNNSEKIKIQDKEPKTTEKSNQGSKLKKDNLESNTPFYIAKIKNETKGSLVYTPKGYGIVQNIKIDTGIITVKVNNEIIDFNRQQVANEIPITLYYVTQNGRREDKLLIPIHSTIKDLIEKIEIDQNEDGYGLSNRVFLKGKELSKSSETIEKINITPSTKLLITSSLGKHLTASRFTSSNSGWGYSSSSVDGISFTTSKDIRVIGFGIYVPNNNTQGTGSARFVQGSTSSGVILYQKEVAIAKSTDNPDDKIYKFLFTKPFKVKSGDSYSCVVELRHCNTYYGSNGTASIEGEQNVLFSFKDCSGSNNGTGISSGQIPEIYYYY